MAWHRYPLNTYCLEAMPFDAGSLIKIARGNSRHLAGQSPATGAPWVANGVRTTGATAFTDHASILWRPPERMLRSCLGGPHRAIQIRAELYMDAGTATVRLLVKRGFRLPGDGAQDSADSAAAAVTSVSAATPTEVTLTVARPTAVALSGFGSGGDQRGLCLYGSCVPMLQAIVNAAPNVCTLRNLAWQEVEPS